MDSEEMKRRVRSFAIRCVKLANSFPASAAGQVIGRQLIKSATSSAANYRAACIARSRSDFVSKLGIVEEEADESVFWIDFAPDVGLAKHSTVEKLLAEGIEIVKIIASSRITAKRPMPAAQA